MKRHREMYDRWAVGRVSLWYGQSLHMYRSSMLIPFSFFFYSIFFSSLQKIKKKKDGEGWRVEMFCLCQGVSRRSRNRQPSVSTNPIGQSDGPSFSRLGFFKGLEEIGTGHERVDLFSSVLLIYKKRRTNSLKEKKKKIRASDTKWARPKLTFLLDEQLTVMNTEK